MPRHFAPFALVLALIAPGCSAPAADTASAARGRDAAAAPPGPAAPASPATPDGRPVALTASDTMKFSVTEIAAKRGEKLSVTLTNVGTTPKFSMGHNWVLLAKGVDPTAFVAVAAEAVTTDYVPAAMRPQILASSKLLGPNEHDTVTFTAPAEPGRYDFLCSFPGHFQVGMRGVLVVE